MRHQTYSYSQSTSQALNKPKIQTRLNEKTRASRLTSGFFRPDESGGNLSVPRTSAETEYFSLITNNEHGLLVIPGSTQPHSRIRPGIFPDTQANGGKKHGEEYISTRFCSSRSAGERREERFEGKTFSDTGWVGYQLKHICQCAKRRVAVALVVVLVEVLMEVMG